MEKDLIYELNSQTNTCLSLGSPFKSSEFMGLLPRRQLQQSDYLTKRKVFIGPYVYIYIYAWLKTDACFSQIKIKSIFFTKAVNKKGHKHRNLDIIKSGRSDLFTLFLKNVC